MIQGAKPRKPSKSNREANGRSWIYETFWEWLVSGIPNEIVRAEQHVPPRVFAAMNFLVPSASSRAAWLENHNKLAAFRWFASADKKFCSSKIIEKRLPKVLLSVESLGVFNGLWLTEGIGFYSAVSALKTCVQPRGLLVDFSEQEVPKKFHIPLHTGMGLAFALDLIRNARRTFCDSDIRKLLVRFVKLCKENSQPGFWFAAFEPLGLLTQILRPRLAPSISRQLVRNERKLQNAFWHGVGRGQYFSFAGFLPCTLAFPRTSICNSVENIKQNIAAGYAWATTLVNVRNPDVVQFSMRRLLKQKKYAAGLVHGFTSAATAWNSWSRASLYLSRVKSESHTAKPVDSLLHNFAASQATNDADHLFVFNQPRNVCEK